MYMAGCEAGGALFAVSQLEFGDRATAQQAMAPLRMQALGAIQARTFEDLSGASAPGTDVQASGIRADGSPVQARLKWIQDAGSLYQLAVYADKLRDEHTEMLISESRIVQPGP